MAAALHLLRVLPLFVMSCFSPDPARRTLRCDAENPCPDGLSCRSSLCVDDNGSDGSTGGSDLGSSDLGPSGSSRCEGGGGTAVGAAWACPAVFGGSSPPASTRCAAGSVPCATGTGIDLSRCKTLPGFFASTFVGRHTSGATVTCMSPNGNNRGVFGCGTGGATQGTACSGFDQALICATSSDWLCADQLEQTRNSNPGNGVLCCAP